MMLVSSTTRIKLRRSSVWAALGADLADGLIDHALDFIRVAISVPRPDVLNGALEHAAADRLLDEFREVALCRALRTQKGARSQIGVLRDLDTPAEGYLFHDGTYTLKWISAYASCPESRRQRPGWVGDACRAALAAAAQAGVAANQGPSNAAPRESIRTFSA